MPVMTEEQEVQSLGYRQATIQPESDSPDFLSDVLPSAFRLDNSLGSFLSNNAPERDGFIDPDFDPIARIPAGLEMFAERYAFANTTDQVSQITKQIEREQADRDTVSRAGGLGVVASMAAGVFDPINLIPVGGTAYKTYRIGGSILRGATVTGRAALLSTTAQEAALQATQMTRTYGESALNITAGTFLGGVLGGSASFVSDFLRASKGKALAEFEADVLRDLTPNQGSAGAAHVGDIDPRVRERIEAEVNKDVLRGKVKPEDELTEVSHRVDDTLRSYEGVDDDAAMKAALKALGKQDPLIRLMNSASTVSRRARLALGESSLNIGKNDLGVATGENVERAIRNHQAKLYASKVATDDLYTQYATGRSKSFGSVVGATLRANVARLQGAERGARKLTYKEFREEVGVAMRNGDVHDIPEVAKAAAHIRKTVYAPLLEDAAKYIDPSFKDLDPKTAVSYLNRKYDIEKLKQKPQGFIDKTTDWLMGRQQDTIRRAEQFELTDREKLTRDIRMRKRELGTLERTTYENTYKEIAKETNARVDELLKELEGRIGLDPADLKVDPKKADAASLKAFFAALKKELGEGIQEEVQSATEIAARETLDDIRLGIDDVPDDEVLALIREQLPPPPARAGQAAAVDAVSANMERATREATVKAQKAYTKSLEAQAKRIAKLAEDPEAATAAVRSKLRKDVAKEATKAARQAAREVTKELREQLRNTVREFDQRKKLHLRDVAERSLERGDFESLAWEIHARIIGTPDGRLPYDTALQPSPLKGKAEGKSGLSTNLKGRKFLIPDNDIQDYLVSDIEELSTDYVRNVAPDIELRRLFPDDDLDLTNTQKQIYEDWQKKSAEEPKWAEKANADIRDIVAIRDKIRGKYGLPEDPLHWGNRAGRAMRQLNYIRLLGGMTLSAIPDMARPVMVHGFSRVFRDALIPMVQDFHNFAKATQSIRDMGLAMDMMNNSRAQALADLTSDFARYSKLERTLGVASDTMGMISLMGPWNTAMKQIAGAVSQGRMIRGILDEVGGKVSGAERKYLRAAGISEEMSKSIADQLKQFGGKTENGLAIPNWSEWTDPDAKRVFQSALGRDVDRIIVTPGLDVPLWAGHSEFGRLIFQFKSFAVASTQRVVLSGLQQRDMATLNGLWFATTLGMLASGLKMADSGRGDELKNWTPEKWLVEGIDRSGVTGWLFEAHNMLEKASRGHLGLSTVTGEAPMSRFASRNIFAALAGPSVGLVTTTAGIFGSAAEQFATGEGWQESDTHAVRRVLPYQNLLGVRHLFDLAEEGVNSSLGVKR